MKARLLYGRLIEAAEILAKKYEPTVWQELLDCMSMRRLRFWFPPAYPRIHPDKLNEEQRREEQRRHEANVKIWLSKKGRMISGPAWPEADNIISQLQEILFSAYQRHEITIFVDDGNGGERLSPLLFTKTISWHELVFPLDFAEDTVESHGKVHKVARVEFTGVAPAASESPTPENTAPDTPPQTPPRLDVIFQQYRNGRPEGDGLGTQDEFAKFAQDKGSLLPRDGPGGLREFFKKETGRKRGRPSSTA